ncbi:hypothetical protein HDV63DRAFT_406711 [Trichoderma sp. SZMC 28014]
MKTSAVIVAAYAAAAAALPSFGGFHWANSTGVNSTSVPSNVTAISNSTVITNSTSGAGASSGVSSVSAIGGDSAATAPYYTNDTTTSNVTYLGGGNQTHFSPNRTHLPVPVRRFRAQRKTLV